MQVKQRKFDTTIYDLYIKQGYSELTAKILASRLPEYKENFVNPSPQCLFQASNFKDMDKAIERIIYAIQNDQKIVLFTDYDTDGCTSMAVLYICLHQAFKVPDHNIIKITGHRKNDGYGLKERLAQQIIQCRPDLVITADTGIANHKEISILKNAGIDVIITDHHLLPQVEGESKDAYAILDAQRPGCNGDKTLCGCGVVWLLMMRLSRKLNCSKEQKNIIFHTLDFVAVGTVGDMVPLTSEINRYYVQQGLKFLNEKQRNCWKTLSITNFNVGILGFQVSPRINASSRISGKATTAIDFLTSQDVQQANFLLSKLNEFNQHRQSIEKKIFAIGEQQYSPDDLFLLVYNEIFDSGVQGIVAGKLAEKYKLPVLMLADDKNPEFLTGSGRSGQFLHIKQALDFVATLDKNKKILVSYGGHKAAAGLKIYKNKLEDFRNLFKQAVLDQTKNINTTPFILSDGCLSTAQLSLQTYYEIEKLAPYGIGFPRPTFNGVMTVRHPRIVGKGSKAVHLSMFLNGRPAIQFSALSAPGDPIPVKDGQEIEVVYQISLDKFRNESDIQLIVQQILS